MTSLFSTALPPEHVFLGDGGEMGRLIRAYDWSATPLGSPETWPQSLKTAVRLMLTSRHPMFIWWGADLIQFYNDAYRATMGPERHPSALGDQGRDCWAEIWPIIGPQIELVMRGEGSTWNEEQLVPVTRHGDLQQVWWTYGYSPIDDGDHVGGVLVVCRDVTNERQARQELASTNATLIRSADRLRDLFGQAPGFMTALSGPTHVFEFTNQAYDRLIGRNDLIGKTVREALPDVAGQGFFELLDRVYETGEAFVGTGLPLTVQPEEGGAAKLMHIDFVYQPVRNAAGQVTGIFVDGYDVTDRVAAESRQKLMVDEMNHRVKNTLSTVQALAMLTGKSARTIGEFQTALTNRIQAMAKTQDLLVRGHSAPLPVRDVITSELAPYMLGDQVQLACEEMTIEPENAVRLGLLVHELLTNAAKYGALSVPEGKLTVRCAKGPGGATLVWREEVEQRQPVTIGGGLGTLLIERLARELRGGARVDVVPGGLEAMVIFALEDHP